MLSVDVASDHTPDFETYRGELSQAGFVAIELVDLSESWSKFSSSRVKSYRENWDRNVAIHGQDLVEGLDHFYSAVDDLFQGGNFGGIRIEAWKP